MRELIEDVFARQLAASELDIQADAVAIELGEGEVMITTDGFTVQPLEFPGGDIGSLAVHGTVNDLAVAGAKPMYLTLNAFIEEGFEVAQLERIVADLGRAALSGARIEGADLRAAKLAGALLRATPSKARYPWISRPAGARATAATCPDRQTSLRRRVARGAIPRSPRR